ncbi:MAG: putative porin [Elusimicrobia bacterium]|nr:putative porin [Elusimicrobiota bacterium]
MSRSSLALIISLAFLSSTARAAGVADQLKLSDHIESLRFNGDLRLRYETFDRKQPDVNDSQRFRYRLRLGMEAALPRQVTAAVRLGAGTGEQFSNNQTLDNLSSQKSLFVDQAYLRWQPPFLKDGKVWLLGGKAVNQFWRPYSADLIWDDDFNPEGFQQGVEWHAPGEVTLFFNALQMVADYDADRYKNQWLFSEQATAEVELPWKTKVRSGVAYHKWSDEQLSSFNQVGVNVGNRRAGAAPGILANRFGVGEWTTEFGAKVRDVPVSLQATLARNFRALGNVAGPKARDGHQFGVIVGKAAEAKTWEVGAFKKYAQMDVTVADVADSDFGEGGTNRVGGIFWAAYAPTGWSHLRVKYFTTKSIDLNLSPGASGVNRLQLDVQVRF